MNAPVEPLITVPLALTAHARAQQFRSHQANPAKAKQVYLNTLAVYAVDIYLQTQGFETDLSASDSWNPTMQTLMDVADLEVKHYGKLECRPILPEKAVMSVPAEVWTERIGYVAVQLDESLRQATLLGFIPTVRTGAIPLEQLDSLLALPEYLTQLKQHATEGQTRLSQWLKNIFEASWQTVEELLLPSQAQPAFNFRSASNTKLRSDRELESADAGTGRQGDTEINKETREENNLTFMDATLYELEAKTAEKLTAVVKRGKLLHLQQLDDKPIALLVGLQPTEFPEINISVEVYPTGGQIYLPQDLKLIVLDEAGEAVMQAQAKSTKKIQLEFSGEPEESFSIKVALGDVSITEAFVI